jgi:hypothetical protein
LTPKQNKADTVEERHFTEAEYEKKQKATDWEERQIAGTRKKVLLKTKGVCEFRREQHPPTSGS